MNRLVAENRLHQAVERQELEVFFQPQANLTTGQIDGVEALVRWRHPSRGLIMPEDFISLSERTGLILPLADQAFSYSPDAGFCTGMRVHL